MKKTLIMLLLSSGFAMATTTNFLDFSTDTTVGNLKYDAGRSYISQVDTTGIPASGKFTTDLYQVNNAGVQTILTFKLNLSRALLVTSDTYVLTLDFAESVADVGLIATSTGLYAANNGAATASGITWTDLQAKTDILSTGTDGDQYVTLTMVHIPANNANPKGIVVYDNVGTVFSDGAVRNSDQAHRLNGIQLNKHMLAAVQVESGWPSTGVNSLTAPFVTTAVESVTIPEPATATLSLLALCGLAARRRRK